VTAVSPVMVKAGLRAAETLAQGATIDVVTITVAA
jgi:hypothetical protein